MKTYAGRREVTKLFDLLVGMIRRLGTGCAKWYTGMNAVNGMLDNA